MDQPRIDEAENWLTTLYKRERGTGGDVEWSFRSALAGLLIDEPKLLPGEACVAVGRWRAATPTGGALPDEVVVRALREIWPMARPDFHVDLDVFEDLWLTWEEKRKTAEREAKRQASEARVAREHEEAQGWYDESPRERDKAKREILRYLRSPEGRDGATDSDVRAHLEDKEELGSRGAQLCIGSLIRARAIKVIAATEDEDRKLYHAREFYRQHPELSVKRRGAQDIETIPHLVRSRIDKTGGREALSRRSVALALSEHFQTTYRSWPKARAIGLRGLAAKAHVDVKTCSQAVDWLADGLLEVVKRGAGSRGNVYRWSPEVRNFKRRRAA